MKLILMFSVILCLSISATSQTPNTVFEGKMLVKDINTIATFQSAVKNSFIKLATNDDPLRSTNIGYFDDGSDKYFFIDTPEGDFGEFTINTQKGFVGIGTLEPGYKLHIIDKINQYACSVEGDRIGVVSSGSNFGLFGSSPNVGTYGSSEAGTGVRGRSNLGIGVAGDSNSSNGYDFFAEANDGSTAYGESSSIRWKTNIRNINDPIIKLSKLRGVYYNWKEEFGGNHAVGFIAEEVGEVLPEIVVYEDNGIDATGLDYSKMTPLLVEAANAMRREYLEKLEDQQSEINTLRKEMTQLKSLLKAQANNESED
jgi:hypothetical protein